MILRTPAPLKLRYRCGLPQIQFLFSVALVSEKQIISIGVLNSFTIMFEMVVICLDNLRIFTCSSLRLFSLPVHWAIWLLYSPMVRYLHCEEHPSQILWKSGQTWQLSQLWLHSTHNVQTGLFILMAVVFGEQLITDFTNIFLDNFIQKWSLCLPGRFLKAVAGSSPWLAIRDMMF